MTEAYALAIGILIGIAMSALMIIAFGFLYVASLFAKNEKKEQEEIENMRFQITLDDGTVHSCTVCDKRD